MVPVLSLWGPIVVSAVIVFVASSLLHMVLPFHRNDFSSVPKEDELLETLRGMGMPAGDYLAPRPSSMAGLKDPAFVAKMSKGPVVVMTVAPGRTGMARNLVWWFVYTIVVGLFSGYITGRALSPGADHLQVFRFVATAGFMGYSLALLQQSIWWNKKWSTTIKSMIDGLTYAVLTGAVFAWMWPPR